MWRRHFSIVLSFWLVQCRDLKWVPVPVLVFFSLRVSVFVFFSGGLVNFFTTNVAEWICRQIFCILDSSTNLFFLFSMFLLFFEGAFTGRLIYKIILCFADAKFRLAVLCVYAFILFRDLSYQYPWASVRRKVRVDAGPVHKNNRYSLMGWGRADHRGSRDGLVAAVEESWF